MTILQNAQDEARHQRRNLDLNTLDDLACEIASLSARADERDPESAESLNLLDLHGMADAAYDAVEKAIEALDDLQEFSHKLQKNGLDR